MARETIEAAAAIDELGAVLDSIGPLAVAVSGGVDSMTLAAVAHRRHPRTTRMFHALSPAVPREATARLKARAGREGWTLSVVEAGEFADPAYRANPINRCFHCKDNLYRAIAAHTDLAIVSGANLDDLGDYRPGLSAAADHGVRHPWVEAKIGKLGVRAVAEALGLDDVAALPASPCLSSRVETGIAIEADMLAAIDSAERFLRRRLRPETVRCRYRHDGVVVELDEVSLARVGAADRSEIGASIAAMFAPGRAVPPVAFAPYRRGSAFVGRGAS